MSVFHKPEPNKWGGQGSQVESHEFYPGRGAINGKIEFKTLGSAQYEVSQKIYNNRRPVLRAMRIPSAGSKIIIFLFENNSFCATGEIRTG